MHTAYNNKWYPAKEISDNNKSYFILNSPIFPHSFWVVMLARSPRRKPGLYIDNYVAKGDDYEADYKSMIFYTIILLHFFVLSKFADLLELLMM